MSTCTVDLRLKYTLLAHFHTSTPKKKSPDAITTTAHSHVIPACLKTLVLITGIYNTSGNVNKPSMTEKKSTLFANNTCPNQRPDPRPKQKRLCRGSTSSHARKTENQVRHANAVARARKTSSQLGDQALLHPSPRSPLPMRNSTIEKAARHKSAIHRP